MVNSVIPYFKLLKFRILLNALITLSVGYIIANNNSIQQILTPPYDAPGVLNDWKNTSGYTWLFSHFSNPGVVTSDSSR